MSPKRALIVLIVVSASIRLFAACTLGLGNDEAYHFLYAIHPALSYYDHPPMLAWVETLGLTLSGSPFSALALRSGFIFLFAASTWLVWRIAGRLYGPWAGLYAALALNLTGYYGLAASTFALPDGPLLFFWLLTIDRLSIALAEPERTGPWIWVGLAWGGAMLSKYHAIFLPAGTLLFLILNPPARRWLTEARAIPGDRPGNPGLQPGALLERGERMGLVPVPGRAGGGRAASPARLPRHRDRGTGRLFLSLDLDPADHHPLAQAQELEPARERPRAARRLPGRGSAGGIHGGRLLSSGLAPLGADRPDLALPDAGAVVASSPGAATGRRGAGWRLPSSSLSCFWD